MKKSAIIFLSALVLYSCKKEKEKSCSTNNDSILGTYKLTASKYKESTVSAEEDNFVLLDACEKDNIINLAVAGVVNYQDIGGVCSPNGSYTSTWSLSGTTLNMDGEPFNIQSFDCTTLIVTQSNVLLPGDLATVTLVKQ